MRANGDRVLEVLEALRQEIRNLRGLLLKEKEELVLGALIRRGFRCTARQELSGLILPSSEKSQERFYELLNKYSFRLFLRDVIKHKESFSLADLLRYCSETTAREYLKLLLRERLIEPNGRARYHLRDRRVVSFGDTLEWLVCAILKREFRVPAAWGLRVEDNRGGGDFDVVAMMEGSFVYIETKSSPPKHIEQHEIGAFFDRLDTLRPDLAVFLEDTQLRMKDKIVVMFEHELNRRFGSSWKKKAPLTRLEREVFGVGDRLFIINSDPDLAMNIGFCLGHYLRSRGLRVAGS